MEYRKLISFGKSSYVISLPKSWLNQNKLKKGDLVYLEEKGQSLVLGGKEEKSAEEKTITIQVDGKSLRRIQREIINSYILDYKTITLVGNEIKEKAKEIQATIHNLVALEVMEETSKRIVARDFLDMNNISFFSMIQKMDVIIRAMFEDCEKMFIEDTSENIAHRDQDVNRLCFLIFRVIEFGFENTSFMYRKYNLTPRHLLHLWWFAFNMEAIADEVKRTARYIPQVKLDKKQQEQFLRILGDTKNKYLLVMKSYHNQDSDLSHNIIDSKKEIIKEYDNFYFVNRRIENVGLLIEKLKSMVTGICNLGRVIQQVSFTFK